MAYAFMVSILPMTCEATVCFFEKVFSRWDSALQKGWLSIFLANHDNARMVSRFEMIRRHSGSFIHNVHIHHDHAREPISHW
jgi:glycosidase